MTRDELKNLFPAVAQLVFVPPGQWWRPTEDCRGCPFASKTDKHPVSKDDHGKEVEFVMCNLLRYRTWEDHPKCTEATWHERAQNELDEIARHLPELRRDGPAVRR